MLTDIECMHSDKVEFKELNEGKSLPLLITLKDSMFDLKDFINDNKGFLENKLLLHGGILFRGFDISTKEKFQSLVNGTCDSLMNYTEGASPRTKLAQKVYTSTEYTHTEHIAQHNELSYASTIPLKIWFCSIETAEKGGQTPIADVRRVLEKIPKDIRDRFEKEGWLLIRNYGHGFGLTWQQAFLTESKAEVINYCETNNLQYEWDGDNLKVITWRPAITRHPKTKEKLWCNHINLWHDSKYDPEVREILVEEFGRDGLAYCTFYKDGTPIEDSVAEIIRKAYDEATIMFDWEKGDFLLLDNMLISHGRAPYEGVRKTLVSMGDPYSPYKIE